MLFVSQNEACCGRLTCFLFHCAFCRSCLSTPKHPWLFLWCYVFQLQVGHPGSIIHLTVFSSGKPLLSESFLCVFLLIRLLGSVITVWRIMGLVKIYEKATRGLLGVIVDSSSEITERRHHEYQ